MGKKKVSLKLILAILVVIVAVQSFFLLPKYEEESSSHNENNRMTVLGFGEKRLLERPSSSSSPKYDNQKRIIPKETILTTSSTKQNYENNNETLLFVHVGKAGGETIKWRLRVICNLRASPRKRAQCQEQFAQATTTTAASTTKTSGGSGNSGESELSKHTIGYMHCKSLRPKMSFEMATTLLFSIRDPMDRIISWFQYMHPLNCIPERPSAACNLKKEQDEYDTSNRSKSWGHVMFQTCFQDINDMLQSLKPPYNMVVGESNCSAIALETVQGRGPPGPSNHLFFNYNYYANRTSLQKMMMMTRMGPPSTTATSAATTTTTTLATTSTTTTTTLTPPARKNKNKKIVVVRQEALWDDLRSIEAMLGGNKYRSFETEGPIVTHGSELFNYKAIANPKFIPYLCCAISNELVIYINLIQHAQNLLPEQRFESIHRISSKCGFFDDGSSGSSGSSRIMYQQGGVAEIFLSQLTTKCQSDDALPI